MSISSAAPCLLLLSKDLLFVDVAPNDDVNLRRLACLESLDGRQSTDLVVGRLVGYGDALCHSAFGHQDGVVVPGTGTLMSVSEPRGRTAETSYSPLLFKY